MKNRLEFVFFLVFGFLNRLYLVAICCGKEFTLINVCLLISDYAKKNLFDLCLSTHSQKKETKVPISFRKLATCQLHEIIPIFYIIFLLIFGKSLTVIIQNEWETTKTKQIKTD